MIRSFIILFYLKDERERDLEVKGSFLQVYTSVN